MLIVGSTSDVVTSNVDVGRRRYSELCRSLCISYVRCKIFDGQHDDGFPPV